VEVPLESPSLLQASHRSVVVFGAEVTLCAVLMLIVSVSFLLESSRGEGSS